MYQPTDPAEAQSLATFIANRPAIEAYKRTRGGDLEHAYQAVTGEAWPAGRSVKIHNGAPQMTADRTFKSVLGRYVAPIAGGALTALTLGGYAPALAAMFGGGGGAAAGTGGSLIGAGTGTATGSALAGAGATAGAGTTIGSLMRFGIPAGINAATGLYGAHTANSAASHAADLDAAAQAETLKFLREQEETRKREFAETQAKNEGLFRAREARLEPYRQLGAGSIGQLMRAPMRMNPGTIGSYMGGR